VQTPAHDDLVRRQFTASAPNTLWLGDITEHWTREGKLYVCAIKDVFSNRIVGYSIDERMKARLAVAAINNAAARRGEIAGCIFHTDVPAVPPGSPLPRSSDEALNHEGMTLVVKDVPADICDVCGEAYFDEAVTQRLLDLAKEAAAAGVVVDVRNYVAASLDPVEQLLTAREVERPRRGTSAAPKPRRPW